MNQLLFFMILKRWYLISFPPIILLEVEIPMQNGEQRMRYLNTGAETQTDKHLISRAVQWIHFNLMGEKML